LGNYAWWFSESATNMFVVCFSVTKCVCVMILQKVGHVLAVVVLLCRVSNQTREQMVLVLRRYATTFNSCSINTCVMVEVV
jgi:hypothetical protein